MYRREILQDRNPARASLPYQSQAIILHGYKIEWFHILEGESVSNIARAVQGVQSTHVVTNRPTRAVHGTQMK